MNIVEKITEWQQSHVDEMTCDAGILISNQELEMVLFAIDNLTNMKTNSTPLHNHKSAMNIRGEARNEYCSDSKFLSMINGDK